jgi:hypothetical protein
MILSSLSQSSLYAALHPLFPRAFDYIRDTDFFGLAPSLYNIVVAPGSGHRVRIPLQGELAKGMVARCL